MKQWVFVFLCTIFSHLGFCAEKGDYFFFPPKTTRYYLKEYTPEEKALVEKDLQVVKTICFGNWKEGRERPVFVATAGGPVTRKSTILERFLRTHPEYADFIYLDPDHRGLKYMVHTYQALSLSAYEMANEIDFSLVTKKAYDKWRSASQYITFTLLEKALLSRFNIVYGTTSTGDYVFDFFKKLKENNFDIVLLLCSCQDSLRRYAIYNRVNEQRFQIVPDEVIAKAKLFTAKMPVYFSLADVLYIYWSDDLFLPEHLAAVFDHGVLLIKDEGALQNFIQKYDADRKILKQDGLDTPLWDTLVKQYQERFSYKESRK